MHFPNLGQIGVSARIRKVATGEDYPEKLEWLKFTSLSFSHTIIKDYSTNVTRNLWVSTMPEPKPGLTEMPWHVITRNIAYSSYTIMFLEQNNPRTS